MEKKTEFEWSEVFARQEASGLAQERFCESEAISYYAFRNAKHRASRRARGLPATRAKQKPLVPRNAHPAEFIPVELVSDFEPSLAPEKPDLTVELPYGVVLRFHGLDQ